MISKQTLLNLGSSLADDALGLKDKLSVLSDALLKSWDESVRALDVWTSVSWLLQNEETGETIDSDMMSSLVDLDLTDTVNLQLGESKIATLSKTSDLTYRVKVADIETIDMQFSRHDDTYYFDGFSGSTGYLKSVIGQLTSKLSQYTALLDAYREITRTAATDTWSDVAASVASLSAIVQARAEALGSATTELLAILVQGPSAIYSYISELFTNASKAAETDEGFASLASSTSLLVSTFSWGTIISNGATILTAAGTLLAAVGGVVGKIVGIASVAIGYGTKLVMSYVTKLDDTYFKTHSGTDVSHSFDFVVDQGQFVSETVAKAMRNSATCVATIPVYAAGVNVFLYLKDFADPESWTIQYEARFMTDIDLTKVMKLDTTEKKVRVAWLDFGGSTSWAFGYCGKTASVYMTTGGEEKVDHYPNVLPGVAIYQNAVAPTDATISDYYPDVNLEKNICNSAALSPLSFTRLESLTSAASDSVSELCMIRLASSLVLWQLFIMYAPMLKELGHPMLVRSGHATQTEALELGSIWTLSFRLPYSGSSDYPDLSKTSYIQSAWYNSFGICWAILLGADSMSLPGSGDPTDPSEFSDTGLWKAFSEDTYGVSRDKWSNYLIPYLSTLFNGLAYHSDDADLGIQGYTSGAWYSEIKYRDDLATYILDTHAVLNSYFESYWGPSRLEMLAFLNDNYAYGEACEVGFNLYANVTDGKHPISFTWETSNQITLPTMTFTAWLIGIMVDAAIVLAVAAVTVAAVVASFKIKNKVAKMQNQLEKKWYDVQDDSVAGTTDEKWNAYVSYRRKYNLLAFATGGTTLSKGLYDDGESQVTNLLSTIIGTSDGKTASTDLQSIYHCVYRSK